MPLYDGSGDAMSGNLPDVLTGINNDAAEGRAVAADEFCRRMDDDVGAVLEGAE